MKRLLVLILLIFFSSQGYSETGNHSREILSRLTNMSIEELMNVSVDRVYSASRFSQGIDTAPSSVTIITREDIKRYGYRTLAEILGSIRGFYRTYDRNYDYIGVRGFSRPGDYNTRVLLMIDGHRINDAIFSNSPVGTEFPLDIDLIEKIEVVRGPASSLYGSNAFFAVVNIITRDEEGLKSLEGSLDIGSFNTYKERLTLSYPFDKDSSMIVSETYYDSKGNERLYFREYDTPEQNNGIAEDLDYDRYKSLFFKINKKPFVFTTVYSKRKKGVPTASYESVFNDHRYFTEEEYFYFDVKYEDNLKKWLKLTSRASYNYFYDIGHFPFDYSETDVPFIVLNREFSKAYWIMAETMLTYRPAKAHRIILGAELIKNLKQEQKNYDIKVYLHDRRHTGSHAFFVQDEYRVMKKVILNMGLRFDEYSTFGSSLNPRIGIIYQPAKDLTLKLLYGRAFRAPSVYELYYGDGDTQKPNEGLGPEKIDTYELVIEKRISPELRTSLSAFYYRTKDLITLKTDPSDGMMYFDNVDEVVTKGIEFELSAHLKKGFRGEIEYSYQEAENRATDSIISNSPRHVADARLSVPLIKDKLFSSLELLYTSKRKTVKGTSSGEVFLANLVMLFKSMHGKLELSAGIYNLFDRQYEYPASEEHIQDVIQQDGRTLRAKVIYRF